MCFCSNNTYPYCDKCKYVFEASKISNMNNERFQEMIRMVSNRPIKKKFIKWAPIHLIIIGIIIVGFLFLFSVINASLITLIP